MRTVNIWVNYERACLISCENQQTCRLALQLQCWQKVSLALHSKFFNRSCNKQGATSSWQWHYEATCLAFNLYILEAILNKRQRRRSKRGIFCPWCAVNALSVLTLWCGTAGLLSLTDGQMIWSIKTLTPRITEFCIRLPNYRSCKMHNSALAPRQLFMSCGETGQSGEQQLVGWFAWWLFRIHWGLPVCVQRSTEILYELWFWNSCLYIIWFLYIS